MVNINVMVAKLSLFMGAERVILMDVVIHFVTF